MFGFLIGLTLAALAAWLGFTQARRFVSERLRYVDSATRPYFPILAGGLATLVALPLAAILPLVSAGTAISFGVSVGLGAAAGRGEILRSLPPGV